MKFTSFVKSSALKRVGAVSLTLALGAGLAGCGGSGAAGGDVAATVNGQDIMEQTVTDYIADFRQKNQLETDEAWGEWMAGNGYTPQTVREEVIDYYIEQDLYDQAAAEYNVTVEQADIDAQLEQTKAMFESDEQYQQALESSGMTEEEYINTVVRPGLLQTKLSEAVAAADSEGQGDDALLTLAQQNADSLNGAKRSSHILISVQDGESDEQAQARAQELLDQINSGAITFEEAAQQNSADTGSAAQGGDVGWDKLTQFVTQYQEALDGLEKDQIVQAPVKSDFGYHIIKCTDVFTVPEGGITSTDQLPEEFVSYLQSMQSTTDAQNFTTWFQEYREKAQIDIKPMPEGLPYDIDMAPYENADDSANATGQEGETAGTTEAPAEGDAAAEGDQAAAEGDATAQPEGDAAAQPEGDQAAQQ